MWGSRKVLQDAKTDDPPSARTPMQEVSRVMFDSLLPPSVRARRSAATIRAKLGLETLENRLVPSTIAGFVYGDLNQNGIKDAGEPGISGNTMELYNASGALLVSAVTDANGHYAFAVDPTIDTASTSREYQARIEDTRTDFSKRVEVAQFDPSLGTLTGVEIINEGTFTSAIKIESLDNAPSMVASRVSGNLTLQGPGVHALVTSPANSQQASVAAFDGTMDFTGASSRDYGTTSATGSRSVRLDAVDHDLSAYIGNGTVRFTQTARATSSASGPGNLLSLIHSTASGNVRVIYHYTPRDALQPGTYTLVQPHEPEGYADGLETKDNAIPIPGSEQTDRITVNLGNQDELNNNFGELLAARIGGHVYLDANNNGMLDAGEPPIPGTILALTGTDLLGNPVQQSTQTADDGSYLFEGLRAGNYTITESQPVGYLQGQNSPGNLGGSLGQDQIFIQLPAGAVGTDYNFGELPPQSPPSRRLPDVPAPPRQPDLAMPLSKRDFIGDAWKQWGW
jgi:hypothetical protein